MRAGTLRKRVTIQQKTITRDAYGAEVIAWATYMSGWASVEPLQGREYLEAQQVQASADVRVRMRVQPSKRPTPGMRAAYDGRIFNIITVIDTSEAGEELQLMCQEQVEG